MDTAQTQDESLVEKVPGLQFVLIFPCNLKFLLILNVTLRKKLDNVRPV